MDSTVHSWSRSTARRGAAEALAAVSRVIAQEMDFQAIGQQIVEAVRGLFEAEASIIFRLDAATGDLVVLAGTGSVGAAFGNQVFPRGTGLVGLAVRERGAVVTPNILADPRIVLPAEARPRIETAGIRVVIAVPLAVKDAVIGALAIADREGRVLGEEDIALAQAFADLAAVALENARLNEETQQRLRETETLLAVSQAIGSPLDLTETMRRVAREMGRVLAADMVGAYVPTADGTALVPLAGYHVPKHLLAGFMQFPIPLRGHRFLEEMWEGQHPVWSSEVGSDPRLDAELIRRVPHRSQLVLPMLVKGTPIGAFVAVWWERERRFARAELRLVEAIARQAAAVVASARLYENLARKNAHLEVLFETARRATLSLDLAEILPVLVQAAMELIGGDGSSIRLLDLDRTALEAVAHHGLGQSFAGRRHVKIGEGFSLAVLDGKTIAIEDLAEDRRYVQRDVTLAEGLRSLVITPLRSRDRVIGALVVYSRRPRRYSDEETSLLTQFANLAAIAIENARLYGATVRREEELGALLRATRTVMAGLDLNVMLERIIEEAAQIAGTPFVTLLLADKEARVLRLGASMGSAIPDFFQVPFGSSYSGTVAVTGQPLFVADTRDDPRSLLAQRNRELGIRTYLGLPVKVRDDVLGVLFFNTVEPRRWTRDEMAVLASFADQAAIAIQNANLFAETERRRRVAESLAEVGRTLSEKLDPDRVGQRVVDSVCGLLGARSAAIYRPRPESGDLAALAIARETADALHWMPSIAPGTGLVSLAIAECGPVSSADVLSDPRLVYTSERRARIAAATHRALLAIPLRVQGRVVGALAVGDQTGRVFGAEEIQIAQAFADQAAVALENAGLYQKAQHAYEELSRTQEQLAQSQKMEAVGRLAGGIAHDFNNLLTIIAGRAQLLLDELWPEDSLHRHVELIMNTADRATTLTRQLLAFSRKQVLQPKVFDLNIVVATMGAMLQRLIGEDITLVTVLHPALGHVNADPGQIEQVIMNLAVNARDAMTQGGTLTIETANVELDAAALAPGDAVRPGPHVMLAVTDTGSGMDAETVGRIFEPFFTTKERGKGTGLGLSTVYGIVRQSNGTVTVASEPGRGSTFRVYLPRIDRPAESAGAGAPPAPAPRGTETLLLVEDEPEVRALAREVLEARGYTVLVASGGPEALALGERHPGIDLMVTDVVMPEMSGPALAERLRPSHPTMRILYMSGYTDDALGHHGLLDAGIAYLQKPFTPSILARKVREVLEGSAGGLGAI